MYSVHVLVWLYFPWSHNHYKFDWSVSLGRHAHTSGHMIQYIPRQGTHMYALVGHSCTLQDVWYYILLWCIQSWFCQCLYTTRAKVNQVFLVTLYECGSASFWHKFPKNQFREITGFLNILRIREISNQSCVSKLFWGFISEIFWENMQACVCILWLVPLVFKISFIINYLYICMNLCLTYSLYIVLNPVSCSN